MDLITYGSLLRKIKTAATGIADIYKDGDYIVFVMADGSKFRIEDSTKDIIDLDFDEDNYIVVTYTDGTTTKSDNPLPLPDVMTGATEEEDGTKGLVPAPTSGTKRYFNSSGGWDDEPITAVKGVSDRVEKLEDAIPTDDIPEGSTLTADGWAVTTDKEVEDEFAKWMED